MPGETKYFRLNNLLGGINSISEENALQTFDFNGQGTQCEARDIENFLPLNRGGQSKTYGYSLFKATGANAITGLYRYTQADGTSYFIYSAGTKVYKLVAGTATDIGATVSNGAYLGFETAQNKLVICDGVNAPQTWDGATVLNIGHGAPHAQSALYLQNRLWLTGDSSNPNELFFSKAGDITQGYDGASTPDGGFVSCDINDGQKITAIEPVFLPADYAIGILVGKNNSVGLVTGNGDTSGTPPFGPYSFAKINHDFGIPGFRQVAQTGQRICYLTPQGVASYDLGAGPYSLFYTQAKVVYQYLSEKVRNQFTALTTNTHLKDGLAWHDWIQTRISFAVPEGGHTYPNLIWHYDYRVNCWYKTRPAHNVTAAFVDTDGTVYTGDDNGNIYQWSKTVTNFAGSAINAYYTTPYLDFGQPGFSKQIDWMKFIIRGKGSYNLGVGSVMDYGTRLGPSTTVPLQTGVYTWDGGTWTNDATVYQWGGPPINISRIYPQAYFNSIQFTFTETAADQPVDIFEIIFKVTFEEDR